jgi:hypothetical protein
MDKDAVRYICYFLCRWQRIIHSDLDSGVLNMFPTPSGSSEFVVVDIFLCLGSEVVRQTVRSSEGVEGVPHRCAPQGYGGLRAGPSKQHQEEPTMGEGKRIFLAWVGFYHAYLKFFFTLSAT